MSKNNMFTGSKVKNQFTAYLLKFVKGRRRDYLKKIQKNNAEELVDQVEWIEKKISVDEELELRKKENLLCLEAKGIYPKWDELENQRLYNALMSLHEKERRFIYQHVFEKRTFNEMSQANSLLPHRVKEIYYYAIQKIRKMMGGG